MEEASFQELVEHTKRVMEPLGHSPSTRWHYDYAWRHLGDFFARHGETTFDAELAQQFVLEIREQYEQGAMKFWKFKLLRKSVEVLLDCQRTGCVTWRYASRWGSGRLGVPALQNILDEYLYELKTVGYGRGTMHLYAVVCRQLLDYFVRENLLDPKDWAPQDISRFILYASTLYQPTSMRTVLSALRSILKFAAERGLTSSALTHAVPSNSVRKRTIVPAITKEEEERLLGAIDRGSSIGKRNYAVVLLALRLGLRSVDIVNLKLENIQWRTNTITITQCKTGRPLTIPLLADVGNAIVDYLVHGRPKVQSPYVFLRHEAPHVRLAERSGVYAIVSSCMKRAGVRQGKGEFRGPHCLRHSLAARLLASDTPLPIISSVLGHANKDTTKIYLSTDLEHLRICALGLSGIEVAKGELQ